MSASTPTNKPKPPSPSGPARSSTSSSAASAATCKPNASTISARATPFLCGAAACSNPASDAPTISPCPRRRISRCRAMFPPAPATGTKTSSSLKSPSRPPAPSRSPPPPASASTPAPRASTPSPSAASTSPDPARGSYRACGFQGADFFSSEPCQPDRIMAGLVFPRRLWRAGSPFSFRAYKPVLLGSISVTSGLNPLLFLLWLSSIFRNSHQSPINWSPVSSPLRIMNQCSWSLHCRAHNPLRRSPPFQLRSLLLHHPHHAHLEPQLPHRQIRPPLSPTPDAGLVPRCRRRSLHASVLSP